MYRPTILVAISALLGAPHPALPTRGQTSGDRAAVSSPGPDSALVSELAELLRGTAQLPGLSVAVMRDQRVVFARGFGFRDLSARVPVDSATQFAAASVSKVITATAALRLHARGLLPLDEPVARSLPEFPGATDELTVRSLAAHLGGIPHYGPGSMPDGRRYASARDALGVFARAPRVGAPGERSVYSTHGITLLSAVMEVAARKPILELLADEVMTPFDMPGTGALYREQPTAASTSEYDRVDGRVVPLSSARYLSYAWAGAGLRSTPSDLVRMSRAYFNGVIPAPQLSLAFTEQQTNAGVPSGVGFIWRVGADWRGRRIAHHAGVSEGARSVLLMFRDEHTSVALQTNLEWVSNIETTAVVLNEALLHSDRAPRTLRAVGRYTGRFEAAPAEGSWEIVGDTGWISTPEPFGVLLDRHQVRVPRLPIRAIRRGVYALVTPWGLYPMSLSQRGGCTRGEVLLGSRTWLLRSAGQAGCNTP